MDRIVELCEKRAKLWEQAKDFLDNRRNSAGVVAKDDLAAYERMEADIVIMGRQIEALERQAVIGDEVAKGVAVKTGTATAEYRDAFYEAVRRINAGISNALGVSTADGGNIVPAELEKKIVAALAKENIVRGLATVVKVSQGERKVPVVAASGSAAWADEFGAFPESDDKLSIIKLGSNKIGTMVKISEELLADSVFDLEAYIAKEFARRIGWVEEEAFLTGDGAGKPMGILNSAEVGVVTAGASITADEIIDLFHSLSEPYRRNAVFIANDKTVKELRKLKDSNGRYLLQPALNAGDPDIILGRPVKTSDFVPAAAAGNKVVAFGDFSHYWIADRRGRAFTRLNERFAKEGQVGFIGTQRVDGKLTLPEAVKVLKIKE